MFSIWLLTYKILVLKLSVEERASPMYAFCSSEITNVKARKSHTDLMWTNNVLATSTGGREKIFIDLE